MPRQFINQDWGENLPCEEAGVEERTFANALGIVWSVAVTGDVVCYSHTPDNLLLQYVTFI